MAESGTKMIWWIFFLLGMGTLLPWNFFITPYNYWMAKLDIKNETDGSALADDQQTYKQFWGSTMALATMATNFVMCFVTTLLMGSIGRNIRFVVPIIGIGICFAIAAVYTKMDLVASQFFAHTMINVVIITGFCAILQASLFGHGGEVGDVMPAIMGGQGVGGIMASLVDITAKLVYDDDVDAAMFFFVIPSLFMVVTGVCYGYLQKLPAYQEKLQMNSSDEKDQTEMNQNDEKDKFLEAQNRESGDEGIMSVIMDFKNGIAMFMLSVFLCFTVTLGLFPAVCQGLQSVNYDYSTPEMIPNPTNSSSEPDMIPNPEYSAFYGRFFLTICVFLMFNVTDTVGRMGSEYFVRPKSPLNFIKPDQPMRLLCLVLLRFSLILLLGKCNVYPGYRDPEAIWFKSDFAFILIMVIFGVTNGLFSSIAMTYAPQRAPENARERVGGLMGTVLVAGLFAGAASSFVLVPLTKQH